MADPQGSIISATALASDSTATRSGSIPETNRRGGPKTVAGKRRSSLNRLGSGLYSNAIVTRGEDRDEYLRFARAIVADLDVQTPLEMACAERIVSALWRSRRTRRYETAFLNAAAERVEELRRFLDEADRELAGCRAEIENVEHLYYPKALPATAIETAASGVLRVAKACLPDSWRDVENAIPHPTRQRVSKKWVTMFRAAIRKAMPPVFKRPPDAFVSLIVCKLHDCERLLELKRERGRRYYESAFPSQFILPTVEGLVVGKVVLSSAAPGKVLADAEGRLDRQVSRAIADFEAARRLGTPR
jgi:hypothetical protein